MKKKEKMVAINLSSGAEKVENIEKEMEIKRQKQGAGMRGDTHTAQGDSALGDSVAETKRVNVERKNAEISGSLAEEESKRAKARVERALREKEGLDDLKKEKKNLKTGFSAYKKYVAEENARIEKRIEARKALIRKRAQERTAYLENKEKEREERMRKRAHKKAEDNQRKGNVSGNATQDKQNNDKQGRGGQGGNGKKRRSENYGGWIATVVALGVLTLALATTVTVGAMEMKSLKEGMVGSHMGAMYELTGTMEHIDDDLDRVRISNSPAQQGRILTDILVQARLAECDLEKLPIRMEEEQNVTAFLNRTAEECEKLLAKLRRGERLSQEDIAKLEKLYKANHSVRGTLDEMLEKVTQKDWTEYLKDGKGMIGEAMQRLEEFTLGENRSNIEEKIKDKAVAGMERNQAEGENTKKGVDALRAEELCKKYFQKYKIEDFQCVGETSNERYSAYNVQGYDDRGCLLFAEIDRKTGALITFDYYEEGSAENFALQNAEMIAKEFVESLGYQNMEIERLSQSGSTSDFTFVYSQDGVLYYPDSVHVKVCRTRGLVCGFDGSKFLKNHRGRGEMNAKITMATAYEKLSDKLSVDASRLAVVQTERGERLAYEMLCSYEKEKYFVYIDGETGEEIAIINAKDARVLASQQ